MTVIFGTGAYRPDREAYKAPQGTVSTGGTMSQLVTMQIFSDYV
jgi:hypothetical protein